MSHADQLAADLLEIRERWVLVGPEKGSEFAAQLISTLERAEADHVFDDDDDRAAIRHRAESELERFDDRVGDYIIAAEKATKEKA